MQDLVGTCLVAGEYDETVLFVGEFEEVVGVENIFFRGSMLWSAVLRG